ncbi:Retrovirus-related Pol polyprotein from transposon TNT 1-94 [Senna tora]|uniref:Retrovirus-related Pol polyprotein from transposon TNT 1-94 n=1 Tax=Senna tora TaxID=362788 RepID=A0A834WU11_9FABA|nr:Retrovirus-related Pol polyprotein from transposon TNT 1-94 [Senna tora]
MSSAKDIIGFTAENTSPMTCDVTAPPSNNVESTAESTLFSDDQLELLQKLFGQPSTQVATTPSTGHIAQSGTFSSTMTTLRTPNDSWIVHSRASYQLLSSVLPHDLASGKMIGSAEEYNGLYLLGSSTFLAFNKKVSGIGSVNLSDNLTLQNVLRVPTLSCNLLSVNRIETQPSESTSQNSTHDERFGKVYTRRHETNTTPMRQTEAEIPRPSSTNSKDFDDNMNLTIALRKGTSSQKDQAILEYSPFPELPVLCPQIIDPALQPQQPSDPPQISPDPDLNLQTNQTLDPIRPLQVYSRRKAPPPTSEPVQSSPSEPQEVEVIDSSSPHIHDYDVPIALRKGYES